MKKIGLLTYHDANNYGAALQTFASFYVLSKYSNCVLLNYKNKKISRQMNLIFTGQKIPFLVQNALLIKKRIKLIKRFKKFLKDNFRLSYEFHDVIGLEKISKNLDCIVVGSDQVWNSEINGNRTNEIYLLPVQGIEKFSYASSFGSYQPSEKEIQESKKLLSEFKGISVRESDAVIFIKEKIGLKADHMLDPTLLLTANEWREKFYDDKIVMEKDFLLVYQLFSASISTEEVENIKKITGVNNVIVIRQSYMTLHNGTLQLRSLGPKEFLNYFFQAKYVMTDSFHGCCFSINLGKDFIIKIPEGRGNRILSVLKNFGLERNVVDNAKKLINFPVYDKNNVSRILENMRSNSIDYIRKICGVANEI